MFFLTGYNPVWVGGVSLLDFLQNEGISKSLIAEVAQVRDGCLVDPKLAYRIPKPRFYYYGTDIWEQALTALLCEENLLLVGPKSTGKNILAENLATAFGRPNWDISFHV